MNYPAEQNVQYRHSGDASPIAVVIALLTAMAAGFAAGVVYASVDPFLSDLPFRAFLLLLPVLVGGFGGLTGFATTSIVKWQKLRNTSVVIAVAVLVALVSYYASWVMWAYLKTHRNDPAITVGDIASNPQGLAQFIAAVNKEGTWDIFDLTPTGSALWIIWSAEAAVILGLAIGIPATHIRDTPFCERCAEWCRPTPEILSLDASEREEIMSLLKTKDLAFLDSHRVVSSDTIPRLRVDLSECPKCGLTNTLTIFVVYESPLKKFFNVSGTKATPVIRQLLLDSAEVDRIRSFVSVLSENSGEGNEEPS